MKKFVIFFISTLLCIATLFQPVLAEMDLGSLNLSIKEDKVNGVTYKMRADDRVHLCWDKVLFADSYELVRLSIGGKVLSDETLERNETEYLFTGLKKNTSYHFVLYAKRGEDVIATSNTLKVTTLSKTSGYFYRKVLFDKDWPGILITNRKASLKEIKAFNNVDEKYMPSIKLNYATSEKRLYINVFCKFEGDGVYEKYTPYKYLGNGKYKKYKDLNMTYKKIVKSAIKDCWSINAKGSSYDFEPGVRFTTSVRFIEEFGKNQRYITILIGDKNRLFRDTAYWFSISGFVIVPKEKDAQYNYRGNFYEQEIILPTQSLLASNLKYEKRKKYHPETSLDNYRQSVSHEFGHALGLDDAYPDNYRKGVKRTVENGGYAKDGKKDNGIMASGNVVKASSNDIEMTLTAQGMAIKKEPYSWQSYENYTECGIKYIKSPVIRK